MATATGLIALRETSFGAMGTEVRVVVPSDVPVAITDRVRALFATWEAALSRFRDDSELSRMNHHAGEPFEASPLLFGVVQAALRAARATGGLYDPLMGQQLCALGYDRSYEQIGRVRPAPVAPAPGGDWRRASLDPGTRCIVVPHGCLMDLGGIAKGMAVDAAVGALRDAGLGTALVSAGGDLRVIGRPPAHAHWGIAVAEHGHRIIALHRGALATSSTTRRRWGTGDVTHHHLLDPCTGLPATRGLRAVTVAARTCAQAEVAAKAALVAGPLAGSDMLRRLGLDALVVPDIGPPVAIGEWPDEDDAWT
ncbi:MAG: FAD:protein FMN transferase [Actinomycetota bacterium]